MKHDVSKYYDIKDSDDDNTQLDNLNVYIFL